MRTIEIRRHCWTKKGPERGKGSHLSAAGVRQARGIGQGLDTFDRVLTSTIPRTLETAIAMGFAVDEQLEVLGDIPMAVWDEIGHQERWTWEQPFVEFARFLSHNGPTTQMGQCQRDIWANALESVPEGGRVLIVSHGRVMESGLVTALPEGDFAHWGPPFQHGEGFQLSYEQGVFFAPQFRRIVQPRDDNV